jgi:hypothetical protein
MRSSIALILVTTVLVSISIRADDWSEPKNGVFTEKQVENYAAAQKEVMQLFKAMGKAVERTKSGAGALALVAGMEDKVNAILARHDLKKPEYEWLSNKTLECMGIAMIDTALEQANVEMADQKKKNAAEIEAGKQKVADYQKALKAGTRVLTKE